VTCRLMLLAAVVLAIPLAGPLWVLAFSLPHLRKLLRDPSEPFGLVAMLAISPWTFWDGLHTRPLLVSAMFGAVAVGLFAAMACARNIARHFRASRRAGFSH
jgi:hypothetical protein